MGDQAVSPSAAWKKLLEFLASAEVKCVAEPGGLDERLGDFCKLGRTWRIITSARRPREQKRKEALENCPHSCSSNSPSLMG